MSKIPTPVETPRCRSSRYRLTLGLLLLAASLPAQARLYKWVDDQGQVHYSDHVPASQLRHQRKILNEQGVEIKTIRAPKTAAELAAERQAEARRQAEAKKAARQAAHDRMLLDTFTNTDDMEMARDGKIAAIEGVIRLTRSRLDNLHKRLDDYLHRAAAFEQAGKPVPPLVQQAIERQRRQIAEYQDFIRRKQQEQEGIRQQFARDIARFRELKGMAAAGAR